MVTGGERGVAAAVFVCAVYIIKQGKSNAKSQKLRITLKLLR